MSLPRVAEPPGKAIPYVIPAYQGEALNIPGSKSTVRVLASAKESENSISVFHLDGILGDPVVFHHHNEAHDIFMCTKGNIKVWAGDKCRVLGPGDFCSVPPKVVHRPQLIGTWNETVGLVTPGTWVDFFRFASEKYDGLLAEEFDNRNTLQFLIPKFQSMKDDYDVIPHPDHPICEAGEWTENDTKIPDGVEAYYLRADSGPRHLLGGILSRPFITTRQSGGKFAITCIESSSHYPFSILESPFTLRKVHQIYHVLDGAINVIMNRVANQVRAGETVLIPAGTEISISFVDRYVRFWSYTSGNGLETFVLLGGREYEGRIVPNKAEPVDTAKIQKAAESINMDITAY